LPFGGRFWLGRTEVSSDRYRKTTGEILPKHDNRPHEPADYLNWNQAVWCAELLGGRLPSEGEYWAAMLSEQLVKDWNDSYPLLERLEGWHLLPVDEENPENVFASSPRRFVHLVTNAAEWTLSRPKSEMIPGYAVAPDDQAAQRLRRIISGGVGDSFAQKVEPLPLVSMRYRRLAYATDQTPGLAFRLARSVRPLVLPPAAVTAESGR